MLERLFIFLMVIFTIGLSTGVSSESPQII